MSFPCLIPKSPLLPSICIQISCFPTYLGKSWLCPLIILVYGWLFLAMFFSEVFAFKGSLYFVPNILPFQQNVGSAKVYFSRCWRARAQKKIASCKNIFKLNYKEKNISELSFSKVGRQMMWDPYNISLSVSFVMTPGIIYLSLL